MKRNNDPVLQKLEQETQSFAEEISRYAPTTNSYGFLIFDTGGPQCCGGCGAFLWFENMEKCFEFIATRLAFLSPSHSSLTTQDEMRKIVEQLKKGEIVLSETETLLNGALAPSSEITWIGPAEELCVGDSDFAIEVRSWYRERTGEEEGTLDDAIVDTTEIAEGEADSFFAALSEYGL